ncbi:thioredoxin family protein [Actinoplanes sp. NPDC051633]|uniref:thioredoxin family protein n=1 Tax=Actinoplanes sp. NPDC051633 TaxID=3155670 RepID=UPI0034430A9C
MTVGLLVAAVVLLAGTTIGLWRRRTEGRLRPAAPAVVTPEEPAGRIDAELLAALGADQPAEVTLLQFSSAFCAPCRAVRRISAEVAAMVPGVRHVEVDAESHLDAVRTLNIWRTPTLLVLDAEGREIKRATGVPGKPQLIAAIGTASQR